MPQHEKSQCILHKRDAADIIDAVRRKPGYRPNESAFCTFCCKTGHLIQDCSTALRERALQLEEYQIWKRDLHCHR